MDKERFLKQSTLLKVLKQILQDPEMLRQVSDAAFDAVDQDQSGTLERNELMDVLRNVAFDMSVKMPTDGDIDAVLKMVDNDGDGVVDRDEFFELINKVLLKMYDAEEELQRTIAENSQQS